MKILVLGEKEEFTKVLLERISKEGQEAYFLATEDFSKKVRLLTRHKFYKLNEKKDLLNTIFQSIDPDIVVFAGKCYMKAQQIEKCKWDSDGYLELLEKVLRASALVPISTFFYLSSSAIYGNAYGTCKEECLNSSDSLLGLCMTEGEYMVRQYAQMYHFKDYIIRATALYGDEIDFERHDFLNSCIKEVLKEKVMQVNKNKLVQPLHVKDFVDALVRIGQNGKEEIYNVSSENVYSLSDIYKKLVQVFNIENPIQEVSGARNSLIDSSKIRKELEWVDLNQLETRFKDEESFIHEKERYLKKNSKKEKKEKSKFPKAVRQVCENVVVFCIFFLLFYFTQSNLLFSKIDWMLLYVAVISIFWGLKQSLLAVILASGAYLFIKDLNIFEMINFYSYGECVLMIAEYIFFGITISYTLDVLRENLRDTQKSYTLLKEDYEELREINRQNVIIKSEYEKRLLVSKSGISNLYDLVSRLMVTSPEIVMKEILNVVSELIETNTVAVYLANKNHSYLRLINALNKESLMEGKSWNISGLDNIKKAIDQEELYEGDIWMDEPAIVLPIRYTDKSSAVIVMKELPYNAHTLYNINLLKTLALLIRDSLVKALDYDKFTRESRYIGDTDILNTESFNKQVEISQGKEDENMAECSIIQLYGKKVEEIYDLVSNMFRVTDHFGQGEHGEFYVLLNNTGEDDLKTISERLEEKGIMMKCVSEEE